MSWSSFKSQGYVYNNSLFNEATYTPAPGDAWYYNQATGSGLGTPSGKVELFSTQIYHVLHLLVPGSI